MRTTHSALIAGLLSLICAASCRGEIDSEDISAAPQFDAAARGSSIVLDPERLTAWIADADNRAVHHVNLQTRAVYTTDVGARPEQIVRVGDSAIAVTLRDTNQVALYEIEDQDDPNAEPRLTLRSTADVAPDPYGIALSSRGELLVTSGFGHTVTSLYAHNLKQRFALDVGREPRGVVVEPEGKRAFVTHTVGSKITVISLDLEEPTAYAVEALGGQFKNRLDKANGAGTLHPTSALAYSAALSPSGERLFVPHVIEQNGSNTVRSVPGAYGGVPAEEETSFASVTVFLTRRGTVLGAAPENSHPIDGQLPIAVDPSIGFAVAPESAPSRQTRSSIVIGDALLVASQGTNELVELDARAIDPATSVRRVFPVGEGPSGVDADEATGLAVVWNQLSHDLSMVHLATGASERVHIADDPWPADVSAGRRLFMTERDRRITRDGRACAGCHPEGREDGVVWKLGAGPRQTPMLVGRLSRGPFGWLGKHDKLEDNMRETISRLGGSGLPEEDLQKIAAYLRQGLIAPNTEPNATTPVDAQTQALAARGKELFASPEVGCANCHALDREASDRAVHTVGTRSKADTTDGYRTPPLLFVGGTGPYFHDGRYETLEALLADNYDRMGTTSHLSKDDLSAIAAFLRTL
ncbi:MAG: c-type cytochrome [Polyangiaceae bacterium]|nr:c-type cytochrome [Polyangiaceae bacterium]